MKTPLLRSTSAALFAALFVQSAIPAVADPGFPCANQLPYGPTEPPCGTETCQKCVGGELVTVPLEDETECSTALGGGTNVFSAYSGNAHRKVVDLEVFGSVGAMPLRFVRYSNTRTVPQNASQGRFGREGAWTHSYQWFLRDGGTYSNGQPALRLGYPSGGDAIFVRNGDTSTEWLPPANAKEKIMRNGNIFTLETRRGERCHFEQLTNASGAIFYRLKTIEDAEANAYEFIYNNATDTLLRRVEDASGRFLKFTYTNLGMFAQQEVTLASVPFNASPTGAPQEVSVTSPTAFRFLALFYSNDFRNAPAGAGGRPAVL